MCEPRVMVHPSSPKIKTFSLPQQYCGSCGAGMMTEPSYQPLEQVAKKGYIILTCYNKTCEQFHQAARIPVPIFYHDPA